MQLSRVRTRVLWIAMLAILFGSLAPSLSAAVAQASGKAWVEICTTSGTKLVQVDGDEPPSDGLHASVHCPYCRLQQDLPAIAHAPGVLVLADGSLRGVLPPPASTPPLTVGVWPAHRSRAPPSFS